MYAKLLQSCLTLCDAVRGLSMGFSRQEYWSRFPCPPAGQLPHPGNEPLSPDSPVLAYRFFTTGATCFRNIREETAGRRSHAVLCLVTAVWLFATQWTVAHPAPLSMRILRARILEWVTMPSERLLLNKTLGFLASRGDEFNPGPETRLDRSELLIKFY